MFAPIIARLILNEHERRIEEARILEKKHNAKQLNDNVFRKLIHVICLESHLFFYGKFGFCIPKNPNLYNNSNEFDTRFGYVIYDESYMVEKEFDRMDDVIPTIEIGENYLKDNYNEIYTQWMEIKSELNQLNKNRDEFFASVARGIGKDLEKELGFKSAGLLLTYGDNSVFFEDNIRKILDILFKKRTVNLTIESKIKDQNYVRFDTSYNVIGSNKVEKINISSIEEIFKRVIYNDKLEEKTRQFDIKILKLNSEIGDFCYQLERKVVNDIDNLV